ncbi:2OG-Fe(II) oxygenase [Roseomonas sp. OT10]|uniref:2OG-Fe(II) oxygenase n=1 Tax=Roseomonas cutis TaxID=2897332 RepID=UPI001E55A090|nr:2OG-Fe(II) oxygenase [Roseomonas sp. OT10]UFN50461.1 2OG-Fe(II) oxygenase [Roseomonas sp. OT10]
MSHAALLPGDIISSLSLADARGEAWDVLQQSIAHLHRVLVLLAGPQDRPAPEALAAAEAEARRRGGVLLVVEAGPPGGAAQAGGVTRLFDPQGALARALGFPRGGVAVLAPRGGLGFLGQGPEALRQALDSLPEPREGVLRTPGAPVLIIPGILEPALVAALLAHWEKGEKSRNRVASAAGAASAAANIKRRIDVPLDDQGLYATFQQRLQRRVLPEMARAFRFRAASFEPPRIGCYDAADAGAFGAHRDNRTPFTQQRRFALSLNLNAHGVDYEGGTLRFPEFEPDFYAPPVGGGAVFGCDMLHEAMPVTRGRRFAIFTFFTDAEGARAEQELIRQRMAAGESGVAMR